MTSPVGYRLSPAMKPQLLALGVRPERVLRRAGLPDDLLSRSDVRLKAEQFFAFAQALHDEADDPLLGIRFVKAMSAELFTPEVFAALCSPNLSVALGRLATFKPLIGPTRLDIDESAAGLQVRYRSAQPGLAPPPFLVGFEALFVVHLARMGTRHPVAPLSVGLPELPEARDAYEDFLGVRIHRSEQLVMTFSADDAHRPFMTENHAMWDIFEPALRRRLADLQGSATVAERATAVLLEAMPSGQVSIQQVSKRLAMSPRTLQRKLRAEGHAFKDLVRTIRERVARHYLAQTELTMSEIAYLLGFEDPSSFFRAFHDWTGQTPKSLRVQVRAAGGAHRSIRAAQDSERWQHPRLHHLVGQVPGHGVVAGRTRQWWCRAGARRPARQS